MPSKYATTSNVRCEENIMTSHVCLNERGSVISDGHIPDGRHSQCIELILTKLCELGPMPVSGWQFSVSESNRVLMT